MTIRRWTKDDFPAIQHLSEREGWPTPIERPEEALRAWQHSWPALVAEMGGEVIGFVRAITDGSVTIYVAEILVAPEWRGRGLGRALLDAVQALCPGGRIDLLATETSRMYYERLGFRPFHGYRRSWLEFDAAERDNGARIRDESGRGLDIGGSVST